MTNPSIDQTLVERLTSKRDRVHPTNRRSDLPMSVKLTFGDLEAVIAALLASTPAGQGEAIPAAERAWLIERTDTDRPTWYAQMHMNPRHYSCWTSDADKAMRFCREQDAQEMVLVLNSITPTNAIATEHAWIAYTPRTLPTTPTDVAAVRAAFTFAFARGFQIAEETSRSCIGSIDEAWEEYAALPLSPATDGMVMVPKEPTEAMVKAGAKAWTRHNGCDEPYDAEIPDIWTAMLAAVETDHAG